LREIEVTGPAKDMKLPKRLPRPSRDYPLIKPEEIKKRRKFVFSSQFPGVQNPVVGIDFMINVPGELYVSRREQSRCADRVIYFFATPVRQVSLLGRLRMYPGGAMVAEFAAAWRKEKTPRPNGKILPCPSL
jgi:hypothetical protein